MKVEEPKENPNQYVIAVDGFSSCGKSTLAKDLAKSLQFLYIDSGAMYRAVTYYCIQDDIDVHDPIAVENILDKIQIRFENKQGQFSTYLNDVNVESEIRDKRVSDLVSEVAIISAVRLFCRIQQRDFAKNNSIVMDGRDIGTVVFPNADVKFFLDAKLEIRTQRRFAELQTAGVSMTKEEVEKNLSHRDFIDSNREDSPLRKAKDAIFIDNSFLNQDEQLVLALNYIFEKIQTLEINSNLV